MKLLQFSLSRLAVSTAVLVAVAIPSSVSAQSVPDLGEAAQFAVLAGSTVTNTGSTIVTGELGVSPGTAITGFPPGEVRDGQIRSNDDVAAQAVADLLSAYNDLAGQSVTTEQAAAMGMGMVLTPGVYHFTDAADITGSLVLDAEGDTTAVFVFQVEEALTVASNAEVTLINSASAASVFWQIGTSATLGTSSRFSGSILAGAGVTLDTGAVLNGRALAQTAVTLDTNTVTITDEPTVDASPVDGDEPAPSKASVPALSGVISLTGESTTAVLRAGSSADGGVSYSSSFTTDQTITVMGELFPEAAHLNQAAEVFVVARYVPVTGAEQWVYKTESGDFRAWNQDVATLQPAFRTASMGASVTDELFASLLDAGTYNVYIGYTAADDELIYNDTPMSFTVTQAQ
ncbi:MAG: ice-binding family protein [Pseudohongiellaceae bacterium]